MSAVAITGLGIVSPLGETATEVHEALCRGESGLYNVELAIGSNEESFSVVAGAMPDFEAAEHLGKRGLRALNRIAKMLTVTAKLAMADAGWDPDLVSQTQAGIAAGSMFSSAHTISEFDLRVLKEGPSRASALDFANTVINAASGQAGIWHQLQGSNSTISAGSSSGLSALAHAADMIRTGRSKILLAGGVEELAAEVAWGFHLSGRLGQSDSSGQPLSIPFDERRNGFFLGEGAALLTLENVELATARGATILARFLGHGESFDFQIGDLEQRDLKVSAEAIERAMRQAIGDANLETTDIEAVSCSANGSQFLDHAEAIALHNVFGKRLAELPVTAIKSSLGESLGAAGAIAALAMVMAIQTGKLSGIRGLAQIPSTFSFNENANQTQDVKISNGLVNALDSSGHCWCAVIGEASV